MSGAPAISNMTHPARKIFFIVGPVSFHRVLRIATALSVLVGYPERYDIPGKTLQRYVGTQLDMLVIEGESEVPQQIIADRGADRPCIIAAHGSDIVGVDITGAPGRRPLRCNR